MGPKPFQFLNRWGNEEGFLDVVKEGWDFPIFGNPFFQICAEIKKGEVLKVKSKEWYISEANLAFMKVELVHTQQHILVCPMDLALATEEH